MQIRNKGLKSNARFKIIREIPHVFRKLKDTEGPFTQSSVENERRHPRIPYLFISAEGGGGG